MDVPRIVVQCDWNEVLRERNGKAWVGFKKQGAKTVYSELTGKRDAAGNIVVKSQDGFSVNQFNLSHITISYHDLNDGNIYEARFQAPSQTFPSIHASKKRVLCIDASNGGLGVSSENDGKVFVWTTENGEIRRILTGHVGDVCVCRFFPSGLVILSGAADCRVKIWSAESGDCAATFIGHTAGISDLAIVERGRNVVSVSRDRSVRLWDCGKSACLANFSPDETVINGCCIGAPTSEVDLTSPNTVADDREVLTAGKLLLLACENNSLFAFELGSRKQIFKSVFESAVNCCAFSTDTTVLCGTEDSFVHMLDLRYTSCPVSSFKHSRSAILSIQPYKNGHCLTSGDGSCFLTPNRESDCALPTTVVEFSGPDCDPVYRCASDSYGLFTCCRDSVIRRYRMI